MEDTPGASSDRGGGPRAHRRKVLHLLHRHRDYGYRPAYVEKLVRECATATGFTRLTGKPARDKVTGALVEDQPIEGIPADSKGEHTGSADSQTSA
jgi:hypothetical protein